jgi:hypothetical protein
LRVAGGAGIGGALYVGKSVNVTDDVVASGVGTFTGGLIVNGGGSTAVTLGTAAGTGTFTFGQSTQTQTTNIQAGATRAGSIKTINIGTNGLTGSNTIVNIGTTASTSTIIVNGAVTFTNQQTVYDIAGTTVGTSPVTLDSFATTLYRSAKYFISIANTVTNQYQTSEIWLIQDGTSAHIEQTSVFSSGTNVISFNVSVSSGTVSLIATGLNPNNSIKVQSRYITA